MQIPYHMFLKCLYRRRITRSVELSWDSLYLELLTPSRYSQEASIDLCPILKSDLLSSSSQSKDFTSRAMYSYEQPWSFSLPASALYLYINKHSFVVEIDWANRREIKLLAFENSAKVLHQCCPFLFAASLSDHSFFKPFSKNRDVTRNLFHIAHHVD